MALSAWPKLPGLGLRPRQLNQWVWTHWIEGRGAKAKQSPSLPQTLRLSTPTAEQLLQSSRQLQAGQGVQQPSDGLFSEETLFSDETLGYWLEQLPTLKQVVLVGPGNPLTLPDLPQLLQWAKTHQISVRIEAPLSVALIQLLDQPVLPDEVSVYLGAHKPSYYGQLSEGVPADFVPQLQRLQALSPRGLQATRLELRFTLLRFHAHEVLAMLKAAAHWGAKQVAFESAYSASEFALKVWTPGALEPLDFTWESVKEDALALSQELGINITDWPLPLSSKPCSYPNEALSLNWQFQVSACPRWAFPEEGTGNTPQQHTAALPYLWDEDFWEAEHFTTLRQAHKAHPAPAGGRTRSNTATLPLPCQNCPERCRSGLLVQ